MFDLRIRVRIARAVCLVGVLRLTAAVTPVPAADKTPAGTPAWSAKTKYDLNRLGIGAGAKIAYARDDEKMTGLSTADGSVKYQRDLPGFDQAGFWGQLDDTTYVYSTAKEVIGIDLETGKDRWHTSPGEGIKANTWHKPTAGNPKALLLAYSKGVSVWDITQGKVLWSAPEPLDGDMAPCVWANASSPDTGVLMFLPKRTVFVGANGKELWSAPEPGNKRRGGEDVRLDAMNSYGRLLTVYTSKQVVLLDNVTGAVLASQSFPSPEAAADVEAFVLGEKKDMAPLLMTLGGRVVIADPKDGKVLGKTPENSVLGQMAGGVSHGDGEYVVLTIVRGNDKTPNVGLHLYRVDVAAGTVKWHAANGGTIDTRQVMQNVVGEKVNGPYFLEKANGVLVATEGTGVRLYNWEDGKERWSLKENLPNSYTVKMFWGGNSFSVIFTMRQNKIYVSTNPPPVEGDGVVYVASEDEVFAIDTASGQLKWKSKDKTLNLVSGLSANRGTVIARQGLYRDANDLGAPTVILTQVGAPTVVEEPEVYIDENPYGYVGLDAATGKEQWKCVDFDARDDAFTGPMPTDKSVCGGDDDAKTASKGAKKKGCKLSKLGIGGILFAETTAAGPLYLGKSGLAAPAPGVCTAAWSVDGSVKKLASVWDLDTKEKSFGYLIGPEASYLVAHYGTEVSVVDMKAGHVLWTAGKAEVVKVVPSAKLLFAADGNSLSMYRLP